jgi:hypothetical protein
MDIWDCFAKSKMVIKAFFRVLPVRELETVEVVSSPVA